MSKPHTIYEQATSKGVNARKRAASKRNLISQLEIDYLSNDRPDSRLKGVLPEVVIFEAYRNLTTCRYSDDYGSSLISGRAYFFCDEVLEIR